jgi:hypothetical protein
LAAGIVVATVALVVIAIVAGLAIPHDDADEVATTLSFLVPIFAFSFVGALIARRRPENLVGWLMATIGLLFAVVVASTIVSVWALRTGTLPKDLAEWISVPSSAWVPALGLLGIQLPLRLPDGDLPSPRWRWFSRATLVLIAVAWVGMTVVPGEVQGEAGTTNPVGSEVLQWLTVAFALVALSFIGGVGALIVRYRRSDAHDRVQLRWVAFGGALFLAVYIVTLFFNQDVFDEDSVGGTVVTVISQVALAALPVSIGYAVLRHRLYDIDTVVNRTLVYGALTATLAVVYLGTVLLWQLVLSPSSDLAVAASTLAVAALFRPARSRIQEAVDRRFYRRRYDAARTLEGFGSRLRDEVDLEAVGRALKGVVAESMQPAHVTLWLRLDPPSPTAFPRRNAVATRHRLTREGSPSLRSPSAPGSASGAEMLASPDGSRLRERP